MPPFEHPQLPAAFQLLQRIGAGGVEKAVMRRALAGLHHQQRFARQPRHHLGHALGPQHRAADNVGGGLHSESHVEHRQALQQALLQWAQAPIAPVQGGLERLVPGHGGAPALGQQLEAVVQLRLQPHQRQRVDLRRRQFDGQRQAIEPPTDFAHRCQVLFPQGKTLLAGPGAADEQLHRRMAHDLRHAVQRRSRRHRQGRQAMHGFPRGSQRFATGGQDRQLWRRGQQLLDHGPAAFEQVLAIVQHQQGMLRCQCLQAGVQFKVVPQVLDQLRRVVDGRQVDEPHTVAVVLQQQLGDPQRDRGLADPRRADQGHEPAHRQLPDQAADHRVAAGDRGQPYRQVVLGLVQAHQRDRLLLRLMQHRGAEAITALRNIDDVASPVLALAEGAAQGGDVHAQVDVLDHRGRPDAGDQFVLAHHLAGALDQHPQDIQGAPAHAQRPIAVEDQPLPQVEDVGAEPQQPVAVQISDAVHAHPRAGNPARRQAPAPPLPRIPRYLGRHR
ncbi:hypothetical protein C4K38_3804 [Pseudomonas chlororaphis subsp. piscium]|nr:hypothetical protein C4K38_3804 [Pseudomonas chlororaphis subsp. piscium]